MPSPKKHTLFITGASGYVGAMLVDQFSKRDDVARIVGLDKEPLPEFLRGNPKLTFIERNMADGGWEETARTAEPDIVIHTAWQIRELYGKRALEWHWNIEGSDRVFDFAFATPSVRRLIHFSTVASYGAFPDNRVDHFYKESEPFRESEYLYSEEKRICEEHLKERYERAKSARHAPQVFIVRPAAITGPRGRFDRIRFGLQSALSGSLKGSRSFAYKIVSLLVSWVPATPGWLRQYVHEDDVADIVALLSFNDVAGEYEAFNLAPPGPVVFAKDMAKAVGKRILPVPPWLVRIAFFCFWHLTRGTIPTSRGSWRGYSYPIAVDGSKITTQCGFRYRYESTKAFVQNEGRYKGAAASRGKI